MSVFPVEKQRVRVHQLVEDDSLVAPGCVHADVAEANSLNGCRGDEVQENLDAAQEVEVVVDPLGRFEGGHAVHEVERADPGLDRVRRQDLLGDLVVEARGGVCAYALVRASAPASAAATRSFLCVIFMTLFLSL